MPARSASQGCSRPYTLGKRQKTADKNRERVLEAARDLLAKEDTTDFSMDAIARQAGVSRQTIHNQFGTRAQLLEALFDKMAIRGGIEGMAIAMQQLDPVVMLQKFIEVFGRFWSSDRATIRHIHALATLDPELGRIDQARNERRRRAATRVIDVLSKRFGKPAPSERANAVDLLFTMTSFEFFDSFAGNRDPQTICSFINDFVMNGLGIRNK